MTPRSMDKTASRVTDERLAEMLAGLQGLDGGLTYQLPSDMRSILTELQSLRAPSESEGEPKRWLIEEHTPSGSISWQVVEHKLHAQMVADDLKNPATISPLYTHPQPSQQVPDAGKMVVSDEIVAAAMTEFVANVRGQDPEWFDEAGEEGEALLTSPSGDFFALEYPMRAALTAALNGGKP